MLSVINLTLLIPAGSSKQYSSVNFYRWVKRVRDRLTSRHQILIELSLEALIKRVFCLGCMLREVTVLECPVKE